MLRMYPRALGEPTTSVRVMDSDLGPHTSNEPRFLLVATVQACDFTLSFITGDVGWRPEAGVHLATVNDLIV